MQREIRPVLLRLVAFIVLGWHSAVAGSADAGMLDWSDVVMPPVFAPARATDRAHFLEFRARTDNEFGHAYMLIETVDAQGAVRRAGIVGFGTATGVPGGVFALLGAPGEVGFTRDDIVRPPIESFRIRIDRATYQRITRSVAEMRETWNFYQLLFLNCNTFIGVVARQAGLNAPGIDALLPADYVRQLKELNALRPAPSLRH